jgi:hypothetical protein
MTTTCIYPESGTTSTSSYTYSTSKSFGECDSCTHREVCKFKNDFEDAKNKFYEKNSKLPILKVQCTYYDSRSLGITYAGTANDQFLKPPYEVTYAGTANDQFLKPPYEVTCGMNTKGDVAND